jgi:hypothetical protein
MLGLIPIGSKSIWDSHEERIALDLEGFRGLEPGPDDLLG